VRRFVLPTLLFWGATAAPALGANVSAEQSSCCDLSGPGPLLTVTVTAKPGEQNATRVEYEDRDVIVEDTAPLTAGELCRQLDEHHVACNGGSLPVSVVVFAGDGSDSFDGPNGPYPPYVAVSVTVRGGPGDDTIHGGDSSDSLSGGPGRDFVDGGPGGDVLFEGGDALEAESIDSDTHAGGEGIDTLSYGGRAEPVNVNLGRTDAQGAAGEDDRASEVEQAIGGSGGDVLVLAETGGLLNGGPGDDALTGSPGADRLYSGGGEGSMSGNAGDDELYVSGPRTERPTVSCGDGEDRVLPKLRRDGPWAELARDCELVSARWTVSHAHGSFEQYARTLDLTGAAWTRRGGLRLATVVRYPDSCCIGTVELYGSHDAPGGKALYGAWCARTDRSQPAVRLTRLGRKRLTPGRLVKAVIRLRYGAYHVRPHPYNVLLTLWVAVPPRDHPLPARPRQPVEQCRPR
jgi:hypothetical protein